MPFPDAMQESDLLLPENKDPERVPRTGRVALWDVSIRVYIVLITCLNLSTNVLVSELVSFFPPLARAEFGLSETEIGTVLGLLALAVAVFSPVAGILSIRFGRLFVMFTGLFFQSLGILGFAYSKTALWFCIARVVQGFGSALLLVCIFALLTSNVSNMTAATTLFEITCGAGFALGSPIGAGLYQTLGFRDLFLFTLSFPLSVAVFLAVLTILRKDQTMAFFKGLESGNEEKVVENLIFSQLVQKTMNRDSVLLSVGAFELMALFGFMQLNFSTHFGATLSFSIVKTGAFTGVISVWYTLSAIIASFLPSYFKLKPLYIISCLLCGLCYVVLGPFPPISPYLDTRVASWIIQVGSSLGLCFFSAIAFVISLPMIRDSIEDQSESVHDFVASVFTTCYSLGEFSGPILAALAVENLPKTKEISCNLHGQWECYTGFSWAATLFGFVVCLHAVLYTFISPPNKGCFAEVTHSDLGEILIAEEHDN